jgi:hypothetical protein
MEHISLDRARAAKPAALAVFRALASVVGVGITRVHDDYAVKVNLREPVEPGVVLPDEVEGVPVHVEVTGTAHARL